MNNEYLIDYSFFRVYIAAMEPVVDTTETTKAQILGAAEARFRQYGYTKTTMAEIADDVGMSTANLYRYFENKQDLAAVCASRCIGEQIEVLREVVHRPGLSASQRLEEFVLAMLHHTHTLTADQPRVNELVETVARERQEIVHQKNEAMYALIAEILAQGNETGEFGVGDVIATARSIYATTVLFSVPIFVKLYPLDEFERVARGVVELLIQGLAKR